MSYFITGDCHGNFDKIEIFCRCHNTNKNDIIIVLGDAGINYWLGAKDERLKSRLSELPISFLCIAGNHEEKPQNIQGYEEKLWKGGIVYYEPIYENLLFAKDGEIYEFGDKKAIAIGGAYSVDKEWRLKLGLPWYESEQPSEEIKAYVESQLSKINWNVDYVLSHTCPLKYEPTDLFLDFIDQNMVDKSTEKWLTDIDNRLSYNKWYFGHFHDDRKYEKAEMLYDGIKELGEENFLQK